MPPRAQLPDWARGHLVCAEHGSGVVGWTDGVASESDARPGMLLGSIRSMAVKWSVVRELRYECGCGKVLQCERVGSMLDDGNGPVFRRFTPP